MLMPLLVRLTDSQVEVADGVVSQAPDGVEDGRDIREEVGSGGLRSIRRRFCRICT